MAVTTQQGVPQSGSPLVGSQGIVTQQWYLFFLNLWTRTGGGQGGSTSGGFLTGEIKAYGGPTVPSGFLACDGAAYSRTGFSNLFSAIGTSWGVGDGNTTFNVPNLQNRTVVGEGSTYTLGEQGGASSVTLSISNLPSHTHTVTDPGHVHTINDPGHVHTINDPGHVHTDAANAANGTTGTDNVGAVSGDTGNSHTGITINSATTSISNNTAVTGITVGTTGTGTSFSSLPPYAAVNWIIKT